MGEQLNLLGTQFDVTVKAAQLGTPNGNHFGIMPTFTALLGGTPRLDVNHKLNPVGVISSVQTVGNTLVVRGRVWPDVLQREAPELLEKLANGESVKASVHVLAKKVVCDVCGWSGNPNDPNACEHVKRVMAGKPDKNDVVWVVEGGLVGVSLLTPDTPPADPTTETTLTAVSFIASLQKSEDNEMQSDEPSDNGNAKGDDNSQNSGKAEMKAAGSENKKGNHEESGSDGELDNTGANEVNVQVKGEAKSGNTDSKGNESDDYIGVVYIEGDEELTAILEILAAKYQVNTKCINWAKRAPLVVGRSWSFDAADGNAILKKYGWEGYAKVHAATEPGTDPKTKEHYHFPIGKIYNGQLAVYLAGVRAALTRAAQYGHDNVKEAMQKLYQALKERAERAQAKGAILRASNIPNNTGDEQNAISFKASQRKERENKGDDVFELVYKLLEVKGGDV